MDNEYNVFGKKKQMRGKDRSKKSILRASRDKIFYAYHAHAKNTSETEKLADIRVRRAKLRDYVHVASSSADGFSRAICTYE